MLLSQITTDPERFQLRSVAYSETTVNGIVRAGLDPARFDPIPLLPAGDGVYVVAGDGHSRLEAVRRLAAVAKLPDAWAVGDDWEVPHKIVTEAQANKLRYANFQRDQLTPVEEARAFHRMFNEDGLTMDEAVSLSHRSESYIRDTMRLNFLCETIKAAIGRGSDGGGIDKGVAVAMAERFQRHNIGHQQQQELYLKVFAHSPLSVEFVRAAIDQLAPKISARMSQGALFEIPATVTAAVIDMRDRARRLAKVARAMKALVGEADRDILDGMPELKSLLQEDGERMLAQLEYEVASDGQVIGDLVVA